MTGLELNESRQRTKTISCRSRAWIQHSIVAKADTFHQSFLFCRNDGAFKLLKAFKA